MEKEKVISFNEFISEENSGGRVKYRYEISDNLKKVSKIQKLLIDVGQTVTEMSDEIIALKTNFGKDIEPDRLSIIDDMQSNLKKMNEFLKGLDGTEGILNQAGKIQRNLEKLKLSYLVK